MAAKTQQRLEGRHRSAAAVISEYEFAQVGYAGVYSTFLLHAKRLGEKYGIDPLEVLVELGRRKTMAGQEDMVLDVTLELARQKGTGTTK